jgi:hypothetical protein
MGGAILLPVNPEMRRKNAVIIVIFFNDCQKEEKEGQGIYENPVSPKSKYQKGSGSSPFRKVAITERFRAGIRRVKDYATHILEHRFGNVPA